jgi:hypothetical protein
MVESRALDPLFTYGRATADTFGDEEGASSSPLMTANSDGAPSSNKPAEGSREGRLIGGRLSSDKKLNRRLYMAQRGITAGIDLVELEKLCGLQCTDSEIAHWFGVTERTISRRRKIKKFNDVMERGKAKGRISVRRMQMKLLENGNATMGVWLGKNILGQTDEVHHQIDARSVSVCVMVPGSQPSEALKQIDDENTIDVKALGR